MAIYIINISREDMRYRRGRRAGEREGGEGERGGEGQRGRGRGGGTYIFCS